MLPRSSLLVAEHLIAQHSAIKMLHSRVKIILEYVKAVESGEWNETKHVEKVWAQLFLNTMFPLNHQEASRTDAHHYKPLFVPVSTSFYTLASIAGEVPFNHEILREANALCHRLPVLSTTKFKTDFYDVRKLCLFYSQKSVVKYQLD